MGDQGTHHIIRRHEHFLAEKKRHHLEPMATLRSKSRTQRVSRSPLQFWVAATNERNRMQAVQGLLNYAPNGPNDGGLMLMKGSSKLFDEFFQHKRESADHEDAP